MRFVTFAKNESNLFGNRKKMYILQLVELYAPSEDWYAIGSHNPELVWLLLKIPTLK